MKIAIGVVLSVLTFAAGLYFDLIKLLVGGIEEIVRSFSAHAQQGHDIAFGILRIVCSGVGGVAAVLIIMAIWAGLLASEV